MWLYPIFCISNLVAQRRKLNPVLDYISVQHFATKIRFSHAGSHICTLTICTLNQKKMFVEYTVCAWEVIKFLRFLVVTMKKTFFGSENSKFRLRHHHRNVFTYLYVKDHVSKLWRLLKKWTKGTFILRPTFVCLCKKNGAEEKIITLQIFGFSPLF